MPLVAPKPPTTAESALALGLQSLAGSPEVGRLYVQLPKLSFTMPHKVFELPLAALLPQGGAPAAPTLATAEHIGWRFLIHDSNLFPNSQPVAAAELEATGGEIRHINFGPFVHATALAIGRLAPLSAFNDADYEVRVLQVLPLLIVALWITRVDGLREVLVPLAPSPWYLTANRQYTVPELFAATAPEAARVPTYTTDP